MIAEELLDASLLVREGRRVVTDGCPAALARLVAVADVRQVRPRLANHVEVVDGARIENDRGVGPTAAHIGDHLDAGVGKGPVVGVAHQDQQRPRHELVHQRVAPARIDGDRRREAGRLQRDAPSPRTLEARAVHNGDREHAAVRPADDADAVRIDEPLRVEEAQRAGSVVEALGGGYVGRLLVAFVADPASGPAVNDQRNVAAIAEPARPGVGGFGDPVAGVQQHDRAERAVALRAQLPARHPERRARRGVREHDARGGAAGQGDQGEQHHARSARHGVEDTPSAGYADSVDRSVRIIADPEAVAAIVAAAGADMERFAADFEAGIGREAVIGDYEAAVSEHGVRSIPTVIVADTGRALVGLADYAVYRAAVEEALA